MTCLSLLLETRDLYFSYNGSKPVLKGVNLKLSPGQKVALWGRNGAGKTTLFRVIMGLKKPSGGEVFFRGKSASNDRRTLGELRKAVGFLFQDPEDQLFCPTLLEDIAFGPLNLGFMAEDAREKAFETMRIVNLESFAEAPPHTLSGGQKRLGALAALLAMDPEAFLLDEPTGDLDEGAREILEDILVSTQAALLVASHDLAFLEKVTSTAYCLEKGALMPV